MGIVLSGAGSDGAAGIVEIERLGGCALVKDPWQAKSPSMPQAALAAKITGIIIDQGDCRQGDRVLFLPPRYSGS